MKVVGRDGKVYDDPTAKPKVHDLECPDCKGKTFTVQVVYGDTAAVVHKCNSDKCGKVAVRYELGSIIPKVYR